jgi:16S rRNA A1518/A1519 N6-dimethyltransferase RsmA/KsgA/DIM1 with predicted DNA glycosylase/AP lyase activity
MKLSEMKQVLVESDIHLTKSLGQNFLHDRNQLRRIVAAAELSNSDRILEIGPGLGPLTELLLETSSEVFAIEKDERLVKILRRRFGNRLVLVHDDALAYLRQNHRNWSRTCRTPLPRRSWSNWHWQAILRGGSWPRCKWRLAGG